MSPDALATLLPILAMLMFASIVGGAAILMARFLGPSRLVGHKIEPYECGIPPTGQARDRISIKYFLVAILFLLFDLEAAFLLPVALAWKELAPIGFALLGFTAFFLFFFLLSLWYEFRVKALEWEQ